MIDLGVFGEVEADVEFDYSPGEIATHDDPECDEFIEIVSIAHYPNKFLKHKIELWPLLNEESIKAVEALVYETRECWE